MAVNRHLVVVEIDARLFDNAPSAAGYIERAVHDALQRDALGQLITGVDLRPAVSCAGETGAMRSTAAGISVAAPPDGNAHLGIATTATLIEELAYRAEHGDTDLGLDYRPSVSI